MMNALQEPPKMRVATMVILMGWAAIGECEVLGAPFIQKITVSSRDAYLVNAYPTIARLADDRLFCVFSVIDTKTGNKAIIVGTFSEDHGRTWSKPITLIDSRPELDYDPNIIVIGKRIIVTSTTVPVTHAKYISTSRTVGVRSEDNGKSWSDQYEIPMGHRYTAGKINAGIVLKNGPALMPYSWDVRLEKTEKLKTEGEEVIRAGVFISKDRGLSWKAGEDVRLDRPKIQDATDAINGIDEPAIVECADGSIYMLSRTGLDELWECRSKDGGQTWSTPVPSALTSHDSPASLCPIRGKRIGMLAVWCNSPKNRWPLSVAASLDDGKTWMTARQLAEVKGYQSSYPGCVQAADGNFVAVWQQDLETGGREVHSARFNWDWLAGSD